RRRGGPFGGAPWPELICMEIVARRATCAWDESWGAAWVWLWAWALTWASALVLVWVSPSAWVWASAWAWAWRQRGVSVSDCGWGFGLGFAVAGTFGSALILRGWGGVAGSGGVSGFGGLGVLTFSRSGGSPGGCSALRSRSSRLRRMASWIH